MYIQAIRALNFLKPITCTEQNGQIFNVSLRNERIGTQILQYKLCLWDHVSGLIKTNGRPSP